MSDTGRFYVKVGKRIFCVEPIDARSGSPTLWGDVDPATKKLTGSYGNKNKGSIHPDDSIITEENGFKNIMTLGPGESPMSYIDELLKRENR